jgi:hypothetical protein
MFHGLPPGNYLLSPSDSAKIKHIKFFSKFKEKMSLFQKAKSIFFKNDFKFKF